MTKKPARLLVIVLLVLAGAVTAWYKRWDIHDFIVLYTATSHQLR